jgi:hypothetical protein
MTVPAHRKQGEQTVNEKEAFIEGYKLALKQWTGLPADSYAASHAEEQFNLWRERQEQCPTQSN